MASLAGRIAIVTGAESGIGAASALALAKAGASVAAMFFQDAEAGETTRAAVAACGVGAIAVQADVGSEADVERAFDRTAATLGTANILVNSAGLNQSGVGVADMSLAQWDRLIRTDLTGAFLTSRRFVRDLRHAGKPGAIVNISSIHARVARAGAADYDAAKGGLHNLTTTLALECAPFRINVNAVAPGMILTPMNARAEADLAYRQTLEAAIPWGRAGTAEEIADIAAFLCGPTANYITGSTITVDGGLSLVLGQGA